MKELLKELGFEHLPMLSEFVTRLGNMASIDAKTKGLSEFDIFDYSDFITQPLTKGMFVPCDEEGNVLKEPVPASFETQAQLFRRVSEYKQAKDRVLFKNHDDVYDTLISDRFSEDFESKEVYTIDNGSWNEYIYTIEQAINNGVKLKLK